MKPNCAGPFRKELEILQGIALLQIQLPAREQRKHSIQRYEEKRHNPLSANFRLSSKTSTVERVSSAIRLLYNISSRKHVLEQ
jgi:hypothetical protein